MMSTLGALYVLSNMRCVKYRNCSNLVRPLISAECLCFEIQTLYFALINRMGKVSRDLDFLHSADMGPQKLGWDSFCLYSFYFFIFA